MADDSVTAWIDGLRAGEESAAAMAESLSQLLAALDPDLRQIALLKLEGRTNEEIATLTGRSLATVERRLRLIRRRWKEEP